MTDVLLGGGAFLQLRRLKRTLVKRTKALCEELDGCRYAHYSPWMCIRPLSEGPVEPELMSFRYTGNLVTDARHLELIDRHLRQVGRPMVEGMSVEYDAWPVMIDIEAERPDAISAYCEGRAILRGSPFLDALFPVLVDCVVPQRRERPSGFDSALALGVVFRTFPAGRSGLLAAFQIAHAMGHQAAILLQSADTLIEPSHQYRSISYKVRKDTRTADHALVSASALAYMCVLARDLYKINAPFIADEHVQGYGSTLYDAAQAAVESLKGVVPMTEIGSRVLEEIEKTCCLQ